MYHNLTRNNKRNITDVLKDSISIESVAQQLNLTLTKHGDELRGDCPTGHPSQSHRSFFIIPDRNFFYCFNCKTAGDIISLVMLVTNADFKDSVRWLAQQFRPDLLPLIEQQTFAIDPQDHERCMRALLYEEVYKLGKPMLFQPTGQAALAALQDRGYDPSNLHNTEWIYWPHEAAIRSHLLTVLPNYSNEIGQLPLSGGFGDHFRIAFPYRDRRGLITGFMKRADSRTGITVNGQTNVRWDSTPGLKKDDLFDLHRIKNEHTLIIVEGYPDALYLPTLGMTNVVAVGQGRLSKNHLDGLQQRNIKRVIISFDNDGVGADNTEDALDLLNRTGIDAFVIDPPLLGYKDPDELVVAKGIDAFRTLVNGAELGASWKAKRILRKHDLTNDLGKDDALAESLAFEESIQNPIASKVIIDIISSGLNLPVEMLEPYLLEFHEKKANERLRTQAENLVKDVSIQLDRGEVLPALELMAERKTEILLDYERSKGTRSLPLDVLLAEKQTRDATRQPGQLLGHAVAKFPLVEKHLLGLQSGLYILGAYPNVGKTALLVNLALRVLEANPAASVALFSMDDSTETIINRCLAILTDMTINDVQFRQIDPQNEQHLKNAYNYLSQFVKEGRLMIKDVSDIHSMDDVEILVRRHQNRENMVVLIDGLYNVSIEGNHATIREENIQRANQAKALSKIFDIPVITSAELRKKISGQATGTPPTLNDIMESGKYGYNADVVWLLYPQDEEKGNIDPEPTMMLKFGKNKLSDFKDVVQLQFVKAKSIYREMPSPNSLRIATRRAA